MLPGSSNAVPARWWGGEGCVSARLMREDDIATCPTILLEGHITDIVKTSASGEGFALRQKASERRFGQGLAGPQDRVASAAEACLRAVALSIAATAAAGL